MVISGHVLLSARAVHSVERNATGRLLHGPAVRNSQESRLQVQSPDGERWFVRQTG